MPSQEKPRAKINGLAASQVEAHALLRETLLGPPIAFHVTYARLTHSATAGLMLSQAVYWTPRGTKHPDGWFEKTEKEWEEETSLSRREQETARRVLRSFPFWKERRQGLKMPNLYKVDFGELCESVRQFVQNERSGLHESAIPECTNPTLLTERRVPSRVSEPANLSLSETSAERAGRSDPAKLHRGATSESPAHCARPTGLVQKLARQKGMTRLDRPSDPLEAEFFDGIYRRNIENTFFDSRFCKFEEQVQYCVEAAATMLALSRVAKLKALDTGELLRVCAESAKQNCGTIALVADFSARGAELSRAVHNLVARVAAAQLRKRAPTLFDTGTV